MSEMNPELLQQLLVTFRDEAAEHLDTLNHALLQFEQATHAEEQQGHIQNAFRAAHSLKGAARAVSLDDIQTIAHGMETVFQAVRDKGVLLGADECDVLYEALDEIRQALSGAAIDVPHMHEQLLAIANTDAPNATEGTPQETPDATHSVEVSSQQDETIRVSLRKLDDLMAEVGELLVSRISTHQRMSETRQINQRLLEWAKSWAAIKVLLKQQVHPQLSDVLFHHAEIMQGLTERLTLLEQDTRRDLSRLEMVTGNLQDKLRRVRMIPFSVHSLMLERVVRDAARLEGKEVQFEIIGGQIELDKRVLELLKDPLIHLLRNAVGHGIEPAQERGDKPTEGHITLKVELRGSEVHLHVTDDGRGFQMDQLHEAYRQRYGEHSESLIKMAFAPGITTSKQVNEIAGRGIGLDVVREQLERIHGRFAVHTEAGIGSTITLIVPTSLAITRVLLVVAEGQPFAIPLMSVEKILIPEQVILVAGKPVLRTADGNIPMTTLSALLGLAASTKTLKPLALVIVAGDQRLAVLVDDVLTEQELAVKPLSFPAQRVANVTGAALMGNGNPVVVLNPAEFLHSYQGATHTLPAVFEPKSQEAAPSLRVLVVDDSITTRTLERNILEAAGYNVITATDGLEALNRLQNQMVDVVVSDIEMPNMNGFELTQTLRDTDSYAHLPIILVTSLEREQDRQRGMVAGANAYIVKRGFDQVELLATIEQLT